MMGVFGSSLLGFLVAIAILVAVHEFGHYLVARWCGVRVLRFSIGFGPVLLRWMGKRSVFRGSEFVLSALPLGGYVRMLDSRDAELASELVRTPEAAFDRQTLWKRSLIVAAGPLANFLLAFVLYSGALAMPDRDLAPVVATPAANTPAYAAGVRGGMRILRVDGREVAHWGDIRWLLLARVFDDTLEVDVDDGGIERSFALQRSLSSSLTPEAIGARLAGWGLSFDQPAQVGTVKAGGPAARAGLETGDRVLSVDGRAVRQWSELTRAIQAAPEVALNFVIERGGTRESVVVTPRADTLAGQRIGRIDIAAAAPDTLAPGSIVNRSRSVGEALEAGALRTFDATVLTVRVLWGMVSGEISLRQVSGPIAMAEGAGATLQQGAVAFTLFLAIVSISLGVLNLLPVPMLDGGQLLYHFFEAIKGAPLSDTAQAVGQRVGIGFVIALTALALYNDILRILS